MTLLFSNLQSENVALERINAELASALEKRLDCSDWLASSMISCSVRMTLFFFCMYKLSSSFLHYL